MIGRRGDVAGGGRIGNRLAMLRAGFATPAKGFVSQPEPRSIGLFARGRQMIAGNFVFAGQLVEAPGASIWDVEVGEPGFAAEAHGFGWLDDLAAVGDGLARQRGQAWVWDWIARYGRGKGPGWTPDLTGRRLIRWINHALFLLNGRARPDTDAYYRSLSAQVVFLARRWPHAAPGLPRFEALTGLISAGLALTGMEGRVGPAVAALACECDREIDAEGGIPTRNPEELLEVFTLLTWAERALAEADRPVPEALLAALERIAPTLRALRHADGGLARFHGGGRGAEGRLDQALSAAGIGPGPRAAGFGAAGFGAVGFGAVGPGVVGPGIGAPRGVGAQVFGAQVGAPAAVGENAVRAGTGPRGAAHGLGLAMGYARLAAKRSSVIVDAAAPPAGRASLQAHASSGAFELTSGRRPLVVNCGSGAPFGAEWHRAGRATASHSTLSVEGFSSSRLGAGKAGQQALSDRAGVVALRQSLGPEGAHLFFAHDGWSGTHGLRHQRELTLSPDGRRLSGVDVLAAKTPAERQRFERLMTDGRLAGVDFALRFHLHPDVDAALDLGGTAVSLALKSGEIWVFRFEGAAVLTLEPSVYLEKGRLRPRAARQIVLCARSMDLEARIGWTLAKAQDTPLAIRDLMRDDTGVDAMGGGDLTGGGVGSGDDPSGLA